MRRLKPASLSLLVVLSLLVSASATCAPCTTLEDEVLEGVRIGVGSMMGLQEIYGDQPSYVRHGWTPCGSCFDGKTMDEICEFINSGAHGFALKINGQPVEPTSITVYYGTPRRNVNTDDTWCLNWVYLFPAGYFYPGLHVLEGTWWINTIPEFEPWVGAEVCFCELTDWAFSNTITLSVTPSE